MGCYVALNSRDLRAPGVGSSGFTFGPYQLAVTTLDSRDSVAGSSGFTLGPVPTGCHHTE